MSKTRNTESGRYAKSEEAKKNPRGTVVENDRRADQLWKARRFADGLTFDTTSGKDFADGANKILSFFDEK